MLSTLVLHVCAVRVLLAFYLVTKMGVMTETQKTENDNHLSPLVCKRVCNSGLLCRFIWFCCSSLPTAEFSDLLPDDMIPNNYMTFNHVVPVSTITGFGIDHLKTCIRLSLDEDAAMETSAIHQKKLQALRYQLT